MKNHFSWIALLWLISTVISDSGPGFHRLEFSRRTTNDTPAILQNTRLKNQTYLINSMKDTLIARDSTGSTPRTTGEVLINERCWYHLEIGVGTPPQRMGLTLEILSADLFLVSRDNILGGEITVDDGDYDSRRSSTYRFVSQFFVNNLFGSTRGDWIKDDVTFDGHTLEGFTMGLSTQTTWHHGVLGLAGEGPLAGFGSNEFLGHRTFPTALVDANITESRSFSIFLNSTDATKGSITFGGIDVNAYTGQLITLPLLGGPGLLTVGLSTVGTGSISIPYFLPAIIEPTSPFTTLPPHIVEPLKLALGINHINVMECIPPTDKRTIDFNFGCLTIKVRLYDMVIKPPIDAEVIFGNTCVFGIVSNIITDGLSLLGDTFLKAAYVVYDLDNGQISIAQANQSALDTESRMLKIPKGCDLLPGAKRCLYYE